MKCPYCHSDHLKQLGTSFYMCNICHGKFLNTNNTDAIVLNTAEQVECVDSGVNKTNDIVVSAAPNASTSTDAIEKPQEVNDDVAKEANEPNSEVISQEDEETIAKLKELLDMGIITQKEFEKKKKQVINHETPNDEPESSKASSGYIDAIDNKLKKRNKLLKNYKLISIILNALVVECCSYGLIISISYQKKFIFVIISGVALLLSSLPFIFIKKPKLSSIFSIIASLLSIIVPLEVSGSLLWIFMFIVFVVIVNVTMNIINMVTRFTVKDLEDIRDS